jgi:hypothetical protein
MRREASHLTPHRFVETPVLLCPPPGGGRMTVLGRKRSLTDEECHIYQYWPRIRDSEEPLLHNPALASGPSRSKSKKLRRPQCPGNHSRARARFRFSPSDSPSRIASCHRRRRIRHSASPKASHVCAETTLRQTAARRNRKLFVPCEQTVDVETLLWSPEENREKSRRDITRSLCNS